MNNVMPNNFEIRESERSDFSGIEALYPEAFPDEDLIPLVRDLLPDTSDVLSLVGTDNVQVVGHVIFTKCGVDGRNANTALLGPLAVAPNWQKRGVGTELVRAGLRLLADKNVVAVFVLGDPDTILDLNLCQSVALSHRIVCRPNGTMHGSLYILLIPFQPSVGSLAVPRQWQQPSLWAP